MTQAHLRIPPSDFASWPQWRRDQWFSEGQTAYYESRNAGAAKPPHSNSTDEKATPKVSLLRGADITPEPIKWLWPGWLAAGKMHVLGGAPGTGKTTLALAIAAAVSNGGVWPDGTRAPRGNVVVWSGEDSLADVLVPRLIAAGANMDRCFLVGDVLENGKARSFDPAKDMASLASAIHEAGGASLLVVDPVVSAVAGDSHKNAEVRRGLQPLVDLAASVGAALVGITHFSKGTSGRDPTERVTGSLAFGALARVVLVAAKIPAGNEDDPPKRVLMRAKSNIGSDDGGFDYDLRQVELEGYLGLFASYVEWGAAIEGTAREVLHEAETTMAAGASGGAVGEASSFLKALLADGAMGVTEIKNGAVGAGLSWAAIRRAKDALGIVPRKSGFAGSGAWEWELPALRCSEKPKDAQQKSVSTLGNLEHLKTVDDAEIEI